MGIKQISSFERAMRDEVGSVVDCCDLCITRKERNEIARHLVYDKCNEDIWQILNERIIEYLY